MTSMVFLKQINASFFKMSSNDLGIEAELSEYFTFDVPNAKHMPSFKNKMWDGKIRLYNLKTKTIYVGLLGRIRQFCDTYGYILDCETMEEYTSDTIDIIPDYKLPDGIELRNYQRDALKFVMSNKRGVLLSPTGSGKSLVIYYIARMMEDMGNKTVVVVPTTSLVEQMYADFDSYSSQDEWRVEEHCQKLYSGFSKDVTSSILISTWQSLKGSDLKGFDAIIGDEAHQFKAKSLCDIMESAVNAHWRIGTTGTLDGHDTNEMVLAGLFGEVTRVTSTRELQDSGTLADLHIKNIILKHSQDNRKSVFKKDFQTEISFITSYQPRNNFVAKLAAGAKGNILVLFQLVEKQGKPLYEQIKSLTNRPVYLIYGDISAEDREMIRRELSGINNYIIVASYGTMSTGINIPSIDSIVFASPSKSKVRNLQSIGRGLRLSDGKTKCTLYDITDDLSHNGKKNHTLNHGIERYKLYTNEGFDINIFEVDLP